VLGFMHLAGTLHPRLDALQHHLLDVAIVGHQRALQRDSTAEQGTARVWTEAVVAQRRSDMGAWRRGGGGSNSSTGDASMRSVWSVIMMARAGQKHRSEGGRVKPYNIRMGAHPVTLAKAA
jgi:hypothetical protein